MKITDKTLETFKEWYGNHIIGIYSDLNGQLAGRPDTFFRLHFDFQYGMLDEFFSSLGIDIFIIPCFDAKYDDYRYVYYISGMELEDDDDEFKDYEDKSLCKAAAIIEANNYYNSKNGQ